MKPKNFSYKKSKSRSFNIKHRFKLLKNIKIFLIVAILVFISLFPITKVKATSTYNQKVTNGIESFPENYQVLLNEFINDTEHNNWNFQAYYTGIDWNDFINSERELNRVYQGFDIAYRCSCNNLASGYYCANSEITSYFIDPRNFINERNIFQFLDVSYNEELYTKTIVEKLVKKYNVFNKGNPITFVMSDENHKDYNKEVSMTYTDIIMQAAAVSKMSPISMIIKIVQEVGASGSGSTNGISTTYPNTYNFFNIGATDTGDAILNGLKYADGKGWHCPYTSIVEGAVYNSVNYIQAGQNTAYFYKYDCVGNKILSAGESQTITRDNLYHQYMTNIQDPYSQSASLFDTYTNNDLLNESLNFIIPVFNNMPVNPVTKISSLSNSDQTLYYANISSSLKIRKTPNVNENNVIKYVYKDDLVIMLQRNYNLEWDKVQLWDGQIGYTMSKYLKEYVPVVNDGGTGGPISPTIEETQTPIVNMGYGYANVTTSLNLRKGPGTSYAIEKSILSKEEFVILEESNSWYKIRLLDGTMGYVSKEYVVNIEYIKVDEENKIITVIPNVKANIVAGKLNGTQYQVKKSDVEILDNSLGTGYVIKIDDNEYNVIKLGDVNGDAEIDVIDLALIKRHLVGTQILVNDFMKAGILQTNGEEIDVIDLALLKRFLIGITNFSL